MQILPTIRALNWVSIYDPERKEPFYELAQSILEWALRKVWVPLITGENKSNNHGQWIEQKINYHRIVC